ncbi:MAG: thioredoxin family protein [Rudaea sp.]
MKARMIFAMFGLLSMNAIARSHPQSIDDALKQAQAEHLPVFADFQAQWCYSCYFMATHVLTGAEWDAMEKRMVVVEVDADSPDGARWMKKLDVKALPMFVVLKPDGSELGRVVAEQPRDKFYAQMQKILSGGDAIDALKKNVDAGSMTAVADVLAGYQARGQFQQGLDWYASLTAARRASAEKDARVSLWRERLVMEIAANAEDHAACVASGEKVLASAIGCDRYYVLESLLDCSEKLPEAERKTLLTKQRPAMTTLLDKQVFVQPAQCADQRTAVLVTADLDKAIGDSSAETAVLVRGIEDAKRRLAGDVGKDRNLADNLRVFLDRAGRIDELDALMPKLMAAYPDDYVYSYRYGASLLKRNRPADALPYLERAAEKTFGANRLSVASLRVKALLALNRRADAEKVVADALEANGPWFPEQAAKLKALLQS